jgi:LysM repeat protein
MRHLRPTARRLLMVSLVVVMLTVTLGSGIASAANTAGDPKSTLSSDTGHAVLCNYTVVPGDSLSRIAVRFGTTIWYLASVNGIANVNRIYSGMHLFVPCGHTPPPPCNCWYRVRAGDTLFRIALRYGTTTGALAAINHISNPSRIYSGTWLRVPCTVDP